MSIKQGSILNALRYTLVSVIKADPQPTWLPKGNWHRYIIGRGNSNLVGYKIGSLTAVTEYAEIVAADLNERSTSGKSSYSVNKKKPAPPSSSKK